MHVVFFFFFSYVIGWAVVLPLFVLLVGREADVELTEPNVNSISSYYCTLTGHGVAWIFILCHWILPVIVIRSIISIDRSRRPCTSIYFIKRGFFEYCWFCKLSIKHTTYSRRHDKCICKVVQLNYWYQTISYNASKLQQSFLKASSIPVHES